MSIVNSCVLGMWVDKDVVEVVCREWSGRHVRLAKTRLILCMPPAVESYTVVELDGKRLVATRGDGRRVDTIFDVALSREEAEDARSWLMLTQYPDEVEALINIFAQQYVRR